MSGSNVMPLCPRCRAHHPRVAVKPEQLRPVRGTEADFAETERLKLHLAGVLRTREPYRFLDLDDFRRVVSWKLGRQESRVRRHLAQLTDPIVRSTTEASFRLASDPSDIAVRVSLSMLVCLPGVGIGVASAALALTHPNTHCVIDFRTWRTFYGVRRDGFGVPAYLAYRSSASCLARRLGWTPQQVDHTAWQLDLERYP